MNLVELKIEGKAVTSSLNVLAFRKYCEAHKVDLDSLFTHLQLSVPFGYLDLFYFGHEAYCELTNKAKLVTRVDCTMFVEEADPDVMTQITKAALEVKLFGKTLTQHAEGEKEAKKKPKP